MDRRGLKKIQDVIVIRVNVVVVVVVSMMIVSMMWLGKHTSYSKSPVNFCLFAPREEFFV